MMNEKCIYTPEEIRRLRQSAVEHVIPHFASNEEIDREPKIFVRGDGCYVWDVEGRKFFDSFATLLTTVCGHNRPEVTAAVREQMELLEFFPNYVDSYTVPLIRLAEKLASLLPGELSVSFFVNSGSEANETAMKMARQFHVENGEKQRVKFLARQDSYHATTLGAGSVTGLKWFREYFEPLIPGCHFVSAARARDRAPDLTPQQHTAALLDEIRSVLEREGPTTFAAFIMDPLPGSNTGYPVPPEGYLRGVREICDRHGILLIFDEVQTGFGKTGRWFYCEHEDVWPDIMTLGKGLTGGFIPLGVTATTPRVAGVFRRGAGSELRSGSTYGGHTVACAATLANIDIIEKEGLVANAASMGSYLPGLLEDVASRHALAGEVSGVELLLALRLRPEAIPNARNGTCPGRWIRDWCYRHGMILRNNGSILVAAPSLILSRNEADLIAGTVDQALTAAEEHFAVHQQV